MSNKTPKRKRGNAPAGAPVGEQSSPPTVDAAVPAAAITLPSSITVKDAASLKEQLLQLLDQPEEVAIDAKSVERVDTAAMQLLCAFVRDRAARNLNVRWAATAAPVLDAARLLGVSGLLGLPLEAVGDAA